MQAVELQVTETVYEPEFTKAQVAAQLNCSVVSVGRYVKFGADYIPDLLKYIGADGNLNGLRILSSDITYLEEIQDLKKAFGAMRVKQILERKYVNVSE